MAENLVQRSLFLLNLSTSTLLHAYKNAKDRSHFDADGCRISEHALNKSGFSNKLVFDDDRTIQQIKIEKGYPKIKVAGSMVFVHHLAFVCKSIGKHKVGVNWSSDFKESWSNASLDVSHVCGKPRCFNEDCLLLERHEYNMTRDYCHGLNSSIGCPHSPACKHRAL
jgi:hypothetical protein